MPQMKPLNWLFLYMMFSIIMMITFIINYYNYLNMKLLKKK